MFTETNDNQNYLCVLKGSLKKITIVPNVSVSLVNLAERGLITKVPDI